MRVGAKSVDRKPWLDLAVADDQVLYGDQVPRRPHPKIRVLLLTNRDSDNVGDQLIEASAISLVKGVMKNLGVAADGFTISSRAAGIVPKAYLASRDPSLLEDARKAIANADILLFGGAPLFNYTYQKFYLRTIITLELAQEYGVPVLFSSIGVEPFDETNAKSLALRKALELPCVRQITTRDDLASVERYVENTGIPVAHVSDPAVFANLVFGVDDGPREGRTIGLVVTREGIFKDNGISFSASEQRRFWLDVIDELTARGYDYTLFTTGHFSDEVFLDAMVKAKRIPAGKVVVTVNSPEELNAALGSCAGVIAYRLHASIASFSYGIPSIGLSWNFKVPYFYESVGHGDRAFDHTRWTAAEVVPALEEGDGRGRAQGRGLPNDRLRDAVQRLQVDRRPPQRPGAVHVRRAARATPPLRRHHRGRARREGATQAPPDLRELRQARDQGREEGGVRQARARVVEPAQDGGEGPPEAGEAGPPQGARPGAAPA